MTDPQIHGNSNTDTPTEPSAHSDPTSLRQVWARNGKTLFLVIVLTWIGLAGFALVSGLGGSDAVQRMALAQLWIMAIILPVAAHSAKFPVDIYYRGGSTNDGFGVFMIAVSTIGGTWGLLTALKLYVLLSSVGLLLATLFLLLRRLRPSSILPWMVATGTGVGIAAVHTFLPESAWAAPSALARANVLLGAAIAAGPENAPLSWLVTSLIYAAGAGLCWSLVLMLPPSNAPKNSTH